MADDKKGMLRHVDVLGRVVIPREVRKSLRINYGDLMEFCACSDNQVIMRKFHLIGEIVPLAMHLVEMAQLNTDCKIIIIDTEKIVSIDKEIIKTNMPINDDIRARLDLRKEQQPVELNLGSDIVLSGSIVFLPIVCEGDVLGGVVVSSDTQDSKLHNIASTLANFLSEYFRG